MKKVKFIHPITGEFHEVMCDKVEGYEQRSEFYHHCTETNRLRLSLSHC